MWDNEEPTEIFIPPESECGDGEEHPQEAGGSAPPVDTSQLYIQRDEDTRSYNSSFDERQSDEPRPRMRRSRGTDEELHNPCLVPARTYRYRPTKNMWKHVPSSIRTEKRAPNSVRIITWNIDAYGSAMMDRADAALRHIAVDLLGCKSVDAEPETCCILLQEVHRQLMPHLLEHVWLQRYFQICPLSANKWPRETDFGNVTLISRSIEVVRSDILDFRSQSKMARTGVITHIKLRAPDPTPRQATIRIINTHLESLSIGEQYRGAQLRLLTEVLRDGDFTDGGIIAGDFNAVCKSDANLARSMGLKDAWKRGDKDEHGFTWGYVGPDAGRYPKGRLDKILFMPHKGYEVEEPRRIGVGKSLQSGGRWPLSDHYGLETRLRMIH